jgi:arginyl-tRNA synthetase
MAPASGGGSRAVEAALAGLIAGIVGPQVASVDLAGQGKSGEFRAHLAPQVDEEAVTAIAERLAQAPEIDRTKPLRNAIQFAPATKTLLDIVAVNAGQPVPGPTSAEHVGQPGAIVTFCSPNANKPLHVGHLRACFLGTSVGRMFDNAGTPALRSQMMSDFGVHICQALAVWEREGGDPASRGMKGDQFVGELYRRYHRELAEHPCPGEGHDDPACLQCRSQQLLRQMTAGDPEALAKNAELTRWSIDGIAETQHRVGVRYDVEFFEHESIPRALEALEKAEADGIVHRRDDGSTYIDVHEAGESELTLLRRDGTTVVFTQFLGVHLARGDTHPGWRVMEFTGEQWRSGRAAMYEVLDRLGRHDLAERIENVWFGMVQVDGATMRSRLGTGVLADDLLDQLRARVGGWADRPEVLAGDDDTLAVALVKHFVLGHPRQKPIEFDWDGLWDSATQGLTRIARAVAWADEADEGPGGPDVVKAHRPLALALAKEGATADKALYQRDPAIVLRYVHELIDLALETEARSPVPAGLRTAFGRVVRKQLDLLQIELPT